MTVAAVMMVRDEKDIIRATLEHLLSQVDAVFVYDNLSTDGTGNVLADLQRLGADNLTVFSDEELGYYQSRKMTRWAQDAGNLGFQWVIPCDADEVWYSPDGRTLKQYLEGVPPDVQAVSGELFNHLPSALDPQKSNPVKRIGWRQRQRAPLPKVCARIRPDLTILAGNHAVSTSGTALTAPGLVVRHFSWRSEDQYLRKIRNGYEAYAATNLPTDTGAHWRMWGPEVPDETIREHFRRWFFSAHPDADGSLIFDPAPI